MKYHSHPNKRDAGGTGEGPTEPSEAVPRTACGEEPRTMIEEVIMRQNHEFYHDRVLTYGSWRNFLIAQQILSKKKDDTKD